MVKSKSRDIDTEFRVGRIGIGKMVTDEMGIGEMGTFLSLNFMTNWIKLRKGYYTWSTTSRFKCMEVFRFKCEYFVNSGESLTSYFIRLY